MNCCFASFHGIEQPRCGQIGDRIRTVPFLDGTSYTGFSEMIFLQASRCSTLIIRLTGPVRDANSSTFPTPDHPISVVLARSGCRANRMSGTESAAPITTV